jgi:protein-S-isoprenylcysteine O-methyltransferase Ste14
MWTSVLLKRKALGMRTAWLFPDLKTFVVTVVAMATPEKSIYGGKLMYIRIEEKMYLRSAFEDVYTKYVKLL